MAAQSQTTPAPALQGEYWNCFNRRLTKGYYTLIDVEDYEKVCRWRWRAWTSKEKTQVYAVRTALENGRQVGVRLHRVVTNAPNGMDVDHRAGRTLDNRKENLRVCSRAQNNANYHVPVRTDSGYRGVYPTGGKWIAKISVGDRNTHLGTFDSPEEAARAWNAKAAEIRGEFARLNDVQ